MIGGGLGEERKLGYHDQHLTNITNEKLQFAII